MFQSLGVIFRLIKYGNIQVQVQKYLYVTIFYKPEDYPKGLKHVALLIVA